MGDLKWAPFKVLIGVQIYVLYTAIFEMDFMWGRAWPVLGEDMELL